MSYQNRDKNILDYKCYPFNGYSLRGPEVDRNKPYMACVGAAQTFGAFCEEPFPTLLAAKLGIQVFNLGLGGAVPSQFLDNKFLKVINHSKLAVLQVLSGRCGSNSRYTTVRIQLGIRHDDYEVVPPVEFWRYAEKKYGKRRINKLVKETRRDYLYKMLTLIRSIKVPKILFYISTLKPEELPERMPNSPFPHFIRRWMIEEMAKFCDEYVECVSNRGMPMKLYDKNGNPTAVKRPYWDSHLPPMAQNIYYPSPQMHEDAAELLAPVCKKWAAPTTQDAT
jgi:hypothetical protein